LGKSAQPVAATTIGAARSAHGRVEDRLEAERLGVAFETFDKLRA
jgi:hypothetical protein